MYTLYRSGLKPGDKIDAVVTIYVREKDEEGEETTSSTEWGYSSYGYDSYRSYKVPVKNITFSKKTITAADLGIDQGIYRGYNAKRVLKEKRIQKGASGIYGTLYLYLTDAGLNKLGDFSSDEYTLLYGEDFTVKVETYGYDEETDEEYTVDLTDNYDFDLDGYKLRIPVYDDYRLGIDVSEIQVGRTADEFREIVNKHLYFEKNDEEQKIDPSKVKITGISVSNKISSNYIASDDNAAIEKALAKEGNSIYIYLETEVEDKNGEPLTVHGGGGMRVYKNSYSIHIEEFEEVTHATGASYERTLHDIMVNTYALKNETEKIRVGSLGDEERFHVNVYLDKGRLTLPGGAKEVSENEAFFSKIQPGFVMDYEVNWYIPDPDREEYDRYYDYEGQHLKFYAYDGKKDVTNPDSEYHQTDGSDAPPLTEANPQYVFNEVTSSTLVGSVKVNIAKKFESFAGYEAAAKHRYKVDNKKLAKVDKNGNVNPKKSGNVEITMEQKNGKTWTKIGDPVKLYIQVPVMEKKKTAKAGETIQAQTYISKTTYNPTKWESTKPAVAEVDPVTGKITFKKKGTAKIIAVYGEGKNSSKKKYKTTVKVS